MKKTKKGIIVWDENADANLKPYVTKTDWKIKNISRSEKGVSLKDSVMTEKYTKHRLPVFTGDTTIFEEVNAENGATGYVVHSSYNTLRGETIEGLGEQVQKFFTNYKASHLVDKVWFIPYIGEPFQKIKSIKRYYLEKIKKRKKRTKR
ncbi:hypothetical protein HGA88_05590 [Candidatus Roizmanbacteria bacterium]|nr:hypothetical protein [Candidatus Roizmanbacteria bacterium]